MVEPMVVKWVAEMVERLEMLLVEQKVVNWAEMWVVEKERKWAGESAVRMVAPKVLKLVVRLEKSSVDGSVVSWAVHWVECWVAESVESTVGTWVVY